MAVATPLFFDTSVLLAGLIELDQPNAPAQQVMDAVADNRLGRCDTAWHCCLEMYSVSTRLPLEFRLTPAQALRLIEEEVFARFRVIDLPHREWLMLLRAAAHDGVAGGRVYDLHIAEIARAAGAATVVTENRRHFLSLLRYGIPVRTSAELLEEIVGDAGAGDAEPGDA